MSHSKGFASPRWSWHPGTWPRQAFSTSGWAQLELEEALAEVRVRADAAQAMPGQGLWWEGGLTLMPVVPRRWGPPGNAISKHRFCWLADHPRAVNEQVTEITAVIIDFQWPQPAFSYKQWCRLSFLFTAQRPVLAPEWQSATFLRFCKRVRKKQISPTPSRCQLLGTAPTSR